MGRGGGSRRFRKNRGRARLGGGSGARARVRARDRVRDRVRGRDSGNRPDKYNLCRYAGYCSSAAERRGLASPRDAMACLTSCGRPKPATGSGTITLRVLKPDPMPAADRGRSALPDSQGKVDLLIGWPVGQEARRFGEDRVESAECRVRRAESMEARPDGRRIFGLQSFPCLLTLSLTLLSRCLLGRDERPCSSAAETRGLASPRDAMACLTSC